MSGSPAGTDRDHATFPAGHHLSIVVVVIPPAAAAAPGAAIATVVIIVVIIVVREGGPRYRDPRERDGQHKKCRTQPVPAGTVDDVGFGGKCGLIGHGGLVVFDDTTDMLWMARFGMEFCAIESCGKCTPCRIGSTRGVETIDKIRKGQDVEKNIELLLDLCNTMKFGSLCALGGFAPYPVESALRHFPEDFRKPALEAAE